MQQLKEDMSCDKKMRGDSGDDSSSGVMNNLPRQHVSYRNVRITGAVHGHCDETDRDERQCPAKCFSPYRRLLAEFSIKERERHERMKVDQHQTPGRRGHPINSDADKADRNYKWPVSPRILLTSQHG